MRVRNYNHFYQLTVFAPIFPINCYVYEEDTYLTVIDVGVNAFARSIQKLSQSLNKPVKNIIITHPHPDHMGGLDEVVSVLDYPVDIYISERDLLMFEGKNELVELEVGGKIKGRVPKVKTSPNKVAINGQKIGSLDVILTPGHTPGSISLYDRKEQTLFCADLMQVQGGLSVAGDSRWRFPFVAMATWSLERSIESVELTTYLNIKILAAGHGNVLFSPREEMLEVIERAKKKLK